MDFSPHSIIIADDDQDDQLLMKEAIISFNQDLKIESVYNGLELLARLNNETTPERISSFQPPIIFMDVNMPFMDGPRALSEIRKSQLFGNIPVYMFSTAPPNFYKHRVENLNVQGLYEKPIKFDELVQIVSGILIDSVFRKT